MSDVPSDTPEPEEKAQAAEEQAEEQSSPPASPAEPPQPRTNSPSWSDLFYGVLVAPVRTFGFLSEETNGNSDSTQSLLGAGILVLLAFGISSVVQSGIDANLISSINFVVCIAFALLTWFTLSCILYLACGWLSPRHTTFNCTLVTTGWAFLPLLFTAPISCFRLLMGHFYLLAAVLPFIWMVYLQLIAFDQAISAGSAKVLAVLLVGPPVFVLVYLFWLSFAFMMITQGVGTEVFSL